MVQEYLCKCTWVDGESVQASTTVGQAAQRCDVADDDAPAAVARGTSPVSYSMFCTCSRSCSIATFISTETLVSSSEAALEASVLASRSSSWIRKSSRLP